MNGKPLHKPITPALSKPTRMLKIPFGLAVVYQLAGNKSSTLPPDDPQVQYHLNRWFACGLSYNWIAGYAMGLWKPRRGVYP